MILLPQAAPADQFYVVRRPKRPRTVARPMSRLNFAKTLTERLGAWFEEDYGAPFQCAGPEEVEKLSTVYGLSCAFS